MEAYVVPILFMLIGGGDKYHEKVAVISPEPIFLCVGQVLTGYNHNRENMYTCYTEDGGTVKIYLSGYAVL